MNPYFFRTFLRCRNYFLFHTFILPQICIYSGHQFCRVKWFRNIIICSNPQTPDLIYRFCPRSDHKNGDIHSVPNFTADLISIFSRKHQIQQNQIKMLLFNHPFHFRSFRKNSCFKSCRLQIRLFNHTDIRIILYNQDLFTVFHYPLLLLSLISATSGRPQIHLHSLL